MYVVNKIERIDWHSYFMLMAKVAALRSGCNNRKTGAVVVKDHRILTTGYNGSLPGQPQCTDHEPTYCFRRSQNVKDESKYNFCPAIHAEANAINQAARFGISLKGSIIYCTLEPCYVCLKSIVSAGISEIYYELAYDSLNKERDSYWTSEINNSIDVFKQVIIPIKYNKIISDLTLLSSERRFNPTL